QHSLNRLRSAASSPCDNCASWPLAAPSADALLVVSALAVWRCGVRLSSNAMTWLASNDGTGGSGGLRGGSGVLASACLVSGFLASSFLSASAIRSRLG